MASTQEAPRWSPTPSKKFDENLRPLTVLPAVWDAISACAARAQGATHLYMSGAAMNNVHGYPDRGVLDIAEVCQVVKEITTASDLPILVDTEAGFGSLPRQARLVDDLLRAGCTAIQVEDQDETGQSKKLNGAALSDPEILCERIEQIRRVAGNDMKILARTDYLPGMDFKESLDRLQAYDDAGADWLQPVFVPTFEELKTTTATFPGRVMALAASPPISGVMRYSPSRAECEEAGVLAVTVTGQYRNMFSALQGIYDQTLSGAWEEMHATRPEPIQLDIDMGVTRRGMDR